MFQKRTDVICRFAVAVTERTRMAAERTTILRPAFARLPGRSAGIVAKRDRLRAARAAPGAHLPRSSWIGPDTPVSAALGATLVATQPAAGQRASFGWRRTKVCLRSAMQHVAAFRGGARGGGRAVRIADAVPQLRKHGKTVGYTNIQAAQTRHPRRQIARDNYRYQEQCCQFVFAPGSPAHHRTRMPWRLQSSL